MFHPEVAHSEEGAKVLANFLDILRLPPRLERALLRRGSDRARARAGRAEGPRALRALRRRRLRGGGAHRARARSATGSPASSSTTACCARTRRRRCASASRTACSLKVVFVDASRRFLSEARGRLRPRAQAQDHRPGVHRGVQGLDAPGGQGRLPGAGHALPGRDRVRLGARAVGGDQEPPQRGRAAEVDEASSWSSRCASCSRTRCARSASSSGSTRSSSTGSRSRAPGSRCAASVRSPGTSSSCCARPTTIFVEEIKAAGALPQAVAVVRGAAAGALGGRDGRRPHLPAHDRAARGRVARRHDRRLGPAAARSRWPGSRAGS